jgi:hypothetical protein
VPASATWVAFDNEFLRIARTRQKSRRAGQRFGSVRRGHTQPPVGAASFLAMADPAAHPALLAPNFSTSFTAATTGHAFSYGGLGEQQSTRSKSKLASRMGLKGVILYGNRPAPQGLDLNDCVWSVVARPLRYRHSCTSCACRINPQRPSDVGKSRFATAAIIETARPTGRRIAGPVQASGHGCPCESSPGLRQRGTAIRREPGRVGKASCGGLPPGRFPCP